MRRFVMFVCLLLVVPVVAYGTPDTVGLYFDSNASVCCSSVMSVPLDLYVVLTEARYPNDVSGWEMRIESDPSVYITGVELSGTGLNLGSFPDFVVGTSEPLVPNGSSVLLARFSVFATSFGGVFIRHAQSPSIIGSLSPIYVRNSNSELIEMNVYSPPGQGGQAGFSANCDSLFSHRNVSLGSYTIDGSKSISIESGSVTEYGNSYIASKSFPDLELLLQDSDLAFWGVVRGVKYECLDVPREGIQSLAFLEFEITENLRGARGSSVVVDVKVNRPGNCITYTVPYFSEFQIGDVCLAVCRQTGNRNKVMRSGIWKMGGNGLVGPATKAALDKTILSKALSSVSRRDMYHQIEQSDFVGIIRVVGGPRGESGDAVMARVVEQYVGAASSDVFEIALVENLDPANGEIVIAPYLYVDTEYLVFLVESSGRFQCVHGANSAFRLNDGTLWEPRDKEWGPVSLAKKLVGGTK